MSDTAKPRVGILGIALESNRWAPLTQLADFEAYALLYGEEAFASDTLAYWLGDDNRPGFRRAMSRFGDWEPIPILLADGQSGGPLEDTVYERLKAEALERLRHALPLDGIYIVAHGAGTTQALNDLDGDYFEAVRTIVGDVTPIIATLDLHANLTPAMVRACDTIVAQRTNPHMDSAQRAEDAARLLYRMMHGERFHQVALRLPLLTPQLSQRTDVGQPLGDVMPLVEGCVESGNVETMSVLPGFALGDTPLGGFWLYACGANQKRCAAEVERIGQKIWAARHDFEPTLMPLREAISRAVDTKKADPPIILADIADNPGGGGSGTTTTLLRAIIEARVKDAAIGLMVEPAIAQCAVEAGIGESIEARFGDSSEDPFAHPFTCEARIEWAGCGDYDSELGVYAGARVPLGPSCRLRVGGLDILVASYRQQALGADMFAHFGVDLIRTRVFIVKSRGHFRSGFAELVAQDNVFEVESTGLTTPVLASLDFQRVERPVVPLDQSVDERSFMQIHQKPRCLEN